MAIYSMAIIFKAVVRILPGPTPDYRPESLMQGDLHETTLALGQKLKLSSVGLYELELINGVSDTLAQNILLSRVQVLNSARHAISYERAKSLELVHGIGEKTAKKLDSVIALE